VSLVPRIRAANIPTHKAHVREAILDAAEESVGRFGYDGTTLSVLADLSELPRSSIYDYFANKDDVLIALIAERVAPLVDGWFSQLPAEPPMERVEAMFTSAFEMAAARPTYARLMLEAHRRLPREVQEQHFPKFLEIMDDLIATCVSAMADGTFAEGDAAGLAGVLSSLLVTGVEDLVATSVPQSEVAAALDLRLRFVRHGAPGLGSSPAASGPRDGLPSIRSRAG
jgi:AcrR family transcriptional regulator